MRARVRLGPRLAGLIALALLWLGASSGQAAGTRDAAQPDRPVEQITIDGAIGPATSRYVRQALNEAAEAGAPLVILRLDTPGGLDGAMRDIVQAILQSPVPVAAFVAPSGARAASAGTYILYASDIAAMAPATNLGAATPVSLGGGGQPAQQPDNQTADKDQSDSPDDSATAERRKIVNDAVAYIRSLAEKNDRNADWAEKAVRRGASLTARQALDRHVIEHIVANERALLAAVDGATLASAGGQHTLDTANRAIQPNEPNWRTRFLAIITQPTVAYLLFMVGIGGLLLEVLTPGTAVPGIVGAICLLIALFAFQVIPVNYAGLGLIALGVGLMVAEMFAPSFGMLGLGGIAAFVFGSIMLMDTGVPGYTLPLGAIAGIGLACAVVLFTVIYLFLSSRRHRIHTGRAGLIGSRCTALEDFEREGWVRLHGESWFAEADAPVTRDQRLIVAWAEGLKVGVRAADNTPTHPSQTAGPPPAGH